MDGWLTSYVLFTVFQLYQDDGIEIMKGCVQWNPVIGWKDPRLQWVSNLGLLEQQASALPTGLRGFKKVYEAYVHTGSNLKVLIAHSCRFFFMTFFFLRNFPLLCQSE